MINCTAFSSYNILKANQFEITIKHVDKGTQLNSSFQCSLLNVASSLFGCNFLIGSSFLPSKCNWRLQIAHSPLYQLVFHRCLQPLLLLVQTFASKFW